MPCWCARRHALPKGHDTNPAEVFSEAEKLASLRHPCVMAFYGIVTSPEAYATVTEYVCHGSLRGGLMKIRKKACGGRGRGCILAVTGGGGVRHTLGGALSGAGSCTPLRCRPARRTCRASATSGCARTSRCRRRTAWRCAPRPMPPCAPRPRPAPRPSPTHRPAPRHAPQNRPAPQYLHLHYMVHFDLKVCGIARSCAEQPWPPHATPCARMQRAAVLGVPTQPPPCVAPMRSPTHPCSATTCCATCGT
jgi:serine/threonine protein kinase